MKISRKEWSKTLQCIARRWIAICGRQVTQALDATLRLPSLLEHPLKPIPPLILSLSYSKLAEGQAFNYKQQEAQAALSKMYDSFVDPIEEDGFIYAEFNRGSLSKSDGKIHYFLGQYDDAFQSIARVVDLKTQALTVPATTERGRVEIINHLALTALKRPNKDKELIVPLWMAGMPGAKNLQSEQRYEEVMIAYHMMEALWSDDAQIRDLRDLMEYW